jgi:hypothetical protein
MCSCTRLRDGEANCMRAINCFPERAQYCAGGGKASTFFTEHASGRGSKHPLNDMQGSHRKFHTPLPRSKGGTDKRVRSEKEAEVRTKKNCSMPATSKPTGNEKAARQLRRPFLQGRIVPTEANSVKTLWRNLMSVKRGVSINFWEINMFVFSSLQKRSTWLGIVQFPGKTPSRDV